MGCDSKRRRREDVGDTTISSSKKQKLMPMTGLEQTQKLLCCGILQELIDHRHGSVAVRIPDSQEVRRPMDLSTVKSKLERDNYSSIDAFVADVKLTFQNALWYYSLGEKQHAMAKNLGKVFEAKWKLRFPETRSSTLKASCATLDRSVSLISPLSLQQLNNNKRGGGAKRSSRNLDEQKGSASAITCAVDKDKERRIKRGLDEEKGSASAITCAVNKYKELRIKRLREQARKEILRVEEAARLKVENPLQDLQQLNLLCTGGIKQDSCYRVYRWLTLEKLGIYLKRDELEHVYEEDEFHIGDWEEDGEQSPRTTKYYIRIWWHIIIIKYIRLRSKIYSMYKNSCNGDRNFDCYQNEISAFCSL
ncbi:bromodomain-containing protein 2-like [Rosa chinensis]|uniref:bromodomain-containing protein 2-like n=1 Tax=Rosa chinensis TaxID=74649 RepID=UPI001AD8C66E|nr:bromodomain-containing protein 2-like [Rosa chinensis]